PDDSATAANRRHRAATTFVVARCGARLERLARARFSAFVRGATRMRATGGWLAAGRLAAGRLAPGARARRLAGTAFTFDGRAAAARSSAHCSAFAFAFASGAHFSAAALSAFTPGRRCSDVEHLRELGRELRPID